MRLLATIAVAGSLLSIANLQAQSLAEHGAAAAGATIGTAAGKPLSGAITKIFGDTDNEVKTVNRGITRPATRATSTAETPVPAGPPPSAAAGSGDVGPGGSSGGSATSSPSALEGLAPGCRTPPQAGRIHCRAPAAARSHRAACCGRTTGTQTTHPPGSGRHSSRRL